MTTVLAAVADDTTRVRVLEAGLALSSVYRARLEPIHVAQPGVPVPGVTDVVDAPVTVVDAHAATTDAVADALVAVIARRDVALAVIGTRAQTETGAPPGHVALRVAERVDKPVALVPPDSPPLPPGRLLRALVPLDGSDLSAVTVHAVVRLAAEADVEIVVLHVFGGDTTPRFLDHAEHDLPTWADEFRARYCEELPSRVVWRSGAPGAAIVETARAEHVDGVILGWGQDFAGGHAEAVRAALSSAGVPVILVPRVHSERYTATADRVLPRRS